MGKGRYIYFQDEISDRLQKEINKSELINKLLISYYKEKDFEGLSKEELETELTIIRLKKDMDAKIKGMRKNG